ncbi:MAG: hypothetical protein NT010_02825 [Proteobacteria bacterium]|nr:hypothetical protein [Pseudomonadota bacterium]
MTRTSNKDKRLKIFQYGATAIAKYTKGDSSHYYCPICGVGYPESSAIAGTDLTLEDVPPKSIGGKPILLTCRQCNSSAGHKIDVCTASKREFDKFERIVCGQENGTIPVAKLSLASFNIAASISRGHSFDVMPLPNANSPTTIEKYKEHLENLAASNANGFEFELSMTQKYDHRLYKLSQLKSSFLLIFAWLGYGYAFAPNLEGVRRQIQEPENDIIGTRFWIEGNESMPLNKVMFLRNPVHALLVSFNGFSIVLPSLNFTDDIYSTLPRYWKKGQRIDLEAQVLLDRWPDRLQMKLDYLEKAEGEIIGEKRR